MNLWFIPSATFSFGVPRHGDWRSWMLPRYWSNVSMCRTAQRNASGQHGIGGKCGPWCFDNYGGNIWDTNCINLFVCGSADFDHEHPVDLSFWGESSSDLQRVSSTFHQRMSYWLPHDSCIDSWYTELNKSNASVILFCEICCNAWFRSSLRSPCFGQFGHALHTASGHFPVHRGRCGVCCEIHGSWYSKSLNCNFMKMYNYDTVDT